MTVPEIKRFGELKEEFFRYGDLVFLAVPIGRWIAIFPVEEGKISRHTSSLYISPETQVAVITHQEMQQYDLFIKEGEDPIGPNFHLR